jgi:Family of unknown function (DUF5906)/Primase C terminal 2 (PriCT-2)
MTDLINTMNADAIRDFMSSVVPWPKGDEAGYINVHWHLPGGPFKGHAVRTLEAFMREVEKLREAGENIYFCLSQQREAKPNGRGLVAVRNSLSATAFRAIWIDLDAGPDKPYLTSKEALEALKQFLAASGMPPPSAMVASGSGGFHVYWFSNKVLIPGVWRIYAEGLKALTVQHGLQIDGGCTADAARVLRVPGTKNWKHNPPREVKLMGMGKEYDFATDLAVLTDVAPAPGNVRSYRPRGPLPQLPARYQGKQTKALIVVKDEDLPPAFPPMPAKELRACLDLIPNTKAEWDRWNTIGMRVYAACEGEDYGLAEWKRWSDKLTTEGKDSCEDRWETYHTSPPTRTGAGALVNEVRRITGNERWLPPKPALRPDVDPQQARNVANSQWPDWTDPLDFQEVPINEAIARVNAAGYFVLTLNGDIYKIEPNAGITAQKREGFTTLFACRQAQDDHGTLVSAGTAWKRSPERREFDAIGYWPDNRDQPAKCYNLWQGWGVEPKEGDWQIIYDHILDVVANGNKAKADFILDFCAHMIQRSWEKPGVALVLRGRKGTGKTLLTRILARIVGTRNTLITASGKKLFQQFNWHVADKLLIGAEEAFFAGNNEQNDQLKHLITGDEIEVEQKFGQRISMKSMHRMIMTSNHDQVVAASDDERRFFVCDVSDKRRGDDDYFSALVRVIKGEDQVTLAAFMYELRTRDINGWKAEKAARNASSIDLARQKLLSLEPPLQWLLEQAEVAGAAGCTGTCVGSEPKESKRDSMLSDYREWFKRAQVRGATDYTNAEKFWASIKRLLNDHIFPRQRLFRTSGGDRFVVMPARRELLDGFNRLLGGKVIDVEE